ncbi:DUF2922 domain-containing protein [Bartonella sp. CL63NXGY]|uniref:DUF2922 domain-containing protein n=1 Tax=Bartonella sp. CL63NXGY TaxID=3243538 RepID=UPI0035CECDC1
MAATVLKLTFIGSLGKSHTIQIANPKKGLDKDTVLNAMNKIAQTHMFFKNDEELYVTPKRAAYLTSSSEPVFVANADENK